MTQIQTVTHDWAEETAESKARWFQALTLTERMNMLCWFTDLILSANPRIVEQKDAEPIAGRVLVLTKAPSTVRNNRRRSGDLTPRAARATFDLDILIEATLENAQRLLDALLDAGLGTAEMTTAEALLAHEITIFRDKVRIDVQTATPGIEFEAAWQKKVS